MFSYARASRSADIGRELKRGRPLAQRADASTAAGRAQRGTAREREGAFGNAVITAEVRYFPVTKHYPLRIQRKLEDLDTLPMVFLDRVKTGLQ